MKVTIAELNVYPVKSCRGISLDTADVGPMGIRYDRQWMFVDERGMFLAQRAEGRDGVEARSLCFVRTAITDSVLRLTAPDMPPLELPLEGRDGPHVDVEVWSTSTTGIDLGPEATRWATEYLSRERPGIYRLVRMPENGRRVAATGDSMLAYADGYPFLVISEASLDDLNRRLPAPLPMNRFRPNIVLGGCEPYGEDRLERMRIGTVEFQGMTLCVRCPIPTTDQDTGERTKEPLKTLAAYRRVEKGVVFGRNFNHRGTGRLAVGDPIGVPDV